MEDNNKACNTTNNNLNVTRWQTILTVNNNIDNTKKGQGRVVYAIYRLYIQPIITIKTDKNAFDINICMSSTVVYMCSI